MATTQLSDVIVPEIFDQYVKLRTEEKSAIIRSGAMVPDSRLDAALAGGGITFNEPFWNPLSNVEENVSSDDPTVKSTANKITAGSEVQVRLSRNNSWSAMDLSAALAGSDPMQAIVESVSDYWVRRKQAAFLATIAGVFADNAKAPTGTEHVLNDMTHNISGSSFTNGVTNFSAEAFVDATATMGDSMQDLRLVMVHSVVFARMLKANMIDYIPVSENMAAAKIPTYLGREVIIDDTMPVTSGVFDTYLFGYGAFRSGWSSPKRPSYVQYNPEAGNGAGEEVLYNRHEWVIHPVGYAFKGTAQKGGPSNATTTGNLAHEDSWQRAFPERKMIKIARLRTREF